MTLEEAIEHAEEVAEEKRYEYQDCLGANDREAAKECVKCGLQHRQLAKWLGELKKLKEKDEAKAVCYEGDGYADGTMIYDYAYCPNCDHEIEIDSENWGCGFCPNCGQRLRWEGEK